MSDSEIHLAPLGISRQASQLGDERPHATRDSWHQQCRGRLGSCDPMDIVTKRRSRRGGSRCHIGAHNNANGVTGGLIGSRDGRLRGDDAPRLAMLASGKWVVFRRVRGKGLSFPECGSGVVRLGLVASILPGRRAIRPQTAQWRNGGDLGTTRACPDGFFKANQPSIAMAAKNHFFSALPRNSNNAFVAGSSGKPRSALILL